jgi:5'-phosphate synthase pdxT subunit
VSTRRRIGVLALQGDFREHLAALRACEVEAVPVRTADEFDRVDALVIPGGESTTMSRLMDTRLRQRIQERAAADLPVMGTCAGMILMASEIQDATADPEPLRLMHITVRRNAYGRQRDSFEAEIDAPILGGRGPAVFIRAPRVTQTGPEVESLASHDGQPIAIREGHRLALAFHPELTSDRRWHQYFLGFLDHA